MASPSSDDILSSDPQFAGLFQRLNVNKDASDMPSAAEVVDDYEGEQETLDLQSGTGEIDEDNADINNEEGEDDDSGDEDAGDEASVGFSGLKDVVKNASKGVTEGTDGEYRRSVHTVTVRHYHRSVSNCCISQMARCTQFLVTKGLIRDGESFFSATPCSNAPLLITAWIMDGYVKKTVKVLDNYLPYWGTRCDEINLDGSDKAPSIVRNTYAHAQKMRAAMTYAFGRLHGLGTLPWHQSEVTGAMVGNPSVSDTVSSYMVSLRRRKVRAGETQTSARAITEVFFFPTCCYCFI